MPFVQISGVFASRASVDAHQVQAVVEYPEGYRNWSHVKSGVIGPTHATFQANGGFQHVYANAQGMAGYRTRVFPEGSVIVVD